ncbi:MAG: hypothetical protein ACLFTK_10255 [Anaerolineales bacterium]
MAQIALPQASAQAAPRVSLEALAYITLLILAALLRVPYLDTTPLDDTQAGEALAAYDRTRLVESSDIFADNALGVPVRLVLFTLGGPSDLAARLPEAVIGSLLPLLPWLFRRELGRWGALGLGLGLAVSPVAVLASREMSGMVWALAALLIGGRFVLNFAQDGRRADAIAASVAFGAVLLLTTPFGLLLALGAFFGLAAATLLGDRPARQTVARSLAAWPAMESLLAIAISVVSVATLFFVFPDGLTHVANAPERFAEAVVAQVEAPTLYPLLVSLRYDGLFVLFGAAGLVVALRDAPTFAERFFAGWAGWAVLGMVLYGGAGPSLALLLTLPAVGLTISLWGRLLSTTSYGYWQVPGWVLPVHGLVVAALLVGLATNLNNVFGKLVEEARPNRFAEVLIPPGGGPGEHVRIGTLDAESGAKSLSMTLPLEVLENCQPLLGDRDPDAVQRNDSGQFCDARPLPDYTVQVWPVDAVARAAELTIVGPDGVTLQDATPLGDGLRLPFQAFTRGEYRINLALPTPASDGPAQFVTILYQGDKTQGNAPERLTNGNWPIDVPLPYAVFQITTRVPLPTAPVGVLGILFSIPITFFLVGAFFGARAAWRGVLLGVMLFGVVYGAGLALGASTVFAEDPRELWNQDPPQEDYQNLEAILEEYSLRDTGMPYLMEIVAVGERDSALGWALRRFQNTTFAATFTTQTNASAIVAPNTLRPAAERAYVGQVLVFERTWPRDSLAWVDFGAWLFRNETRVEPEVSSRYRVWIASEVYDVQTVPTP